ncbi:MAG: dTMP kinase [Patescibacteria group bacterium]
MTKKGKFIVLEGGEGAGKSSQIAELKKEFGDSILTTREPGGSPFAEKIRSLILSPEAGETEAKTLFGLFWAARADHLNKTIIPALTAGRHVLCDRFDSSSYVYQIYGQEDPGLQELFFQVRDVYLGEYRPDLYIYLEIDPQIGLKRKVAQTEELSNHFDDRDLDFHWRIKKGFGEFFNSVSCQKVDANLPFEVVREELLQIVKLLIGDEDKN